MTYVCVTGNEQSPAALEQRLERVLASHPRVLCEARLDYLDLSPAAAFAFLAKLPAQMAPRLILTQRLKASGPLAAGHCPWDVMTWQSWWKDVMALRPWFAVDLDWLVLDRLAGESLAWRGSFRSRHAFFSLHAPVKEIEAALPELLASAKEHNAGVKIAGPVESARDLAQLATFSRSLAELPLRVAVAMGDTGRAWRWSRLAGDITYFAAESARATAPGQESLGAVLPYLSTKQRPDLYVLLGDNADNRYGEERWNRAFIRRGAKARYVNCATSDEPGPFWAENTLRWLNGAGVKGASVTKPYKLSFPAPTNTLKRVGEQWERANTDGSAVAALLERYGILPGEAIVIAGGGGAAQAVKHGLEQAGYRASLWVREGGELGPCPEGSVLVSTWPGPYQEALVQAIPGARAFRLVVDAQLTRPPEESPLAQFAQRRRARYLGGGFWWREQARRQDELWFGPDRLGAAGGAILSLVPASKSETLRALALSLACGIPAEIRGPAQNEDTEVFLAALEKLGVAVDREEDLWRLYPPREIQAPAEPVFLGEGATGLRILAAISTLMRGTLRLSGTDRLQERPAGDLHASLGASPGWPLTLEGGRPLPGLISLGRSSQFATGFLLAAAGALYRGKIDEYVLELEGELRSETYLHLTAALLREVGIEVEQGERKIRLRLVDRKNKFHFSIEKDASSLAFLEAYAARWNLRSFFGPSRQGDGDFPLFLERLRRGESLSLKNHPDLAPPLWAAAAFLRLRLEITDCPHLHWKESDRAKRLAEAAEKLGAPAEEREDGLVADFRRWVPPAEETFLRTDGDHRLAMAFGLLATDDPNLAPDRRDCVRKSFPSFWQALTLLEEALPG